MDLVTGLSLCFFTMLVNAINSEISFAGSSYHCDCLDILEKENMYTTAHITLHL